MAKVNINNKSYQGRTVVINNGNVIVDGRNVTPENDKTISVTVHGEVNELKVDYCQDVTINGSVGGVSTASGDVKCGDVKGSVSTMSGDVECGKVSGSVSTMSGDISCEK